MAVINGTPAGEPLNGTAGNDTITGAGGADTIAMLGGSDLSLWSLGDGSDVVEGGTGTDTARLASRRRIVQRRRQVVLEQVFVAAGVGGAGAEIVTLNDVERLELLASAFYNTVTVGDLSGTDVTKVTVDFAGGANDVATVYASSANNTLTVTNAANTDQRRWPSDAILRHPHGHIGHRRRARRRRQRQAECVPCSQGDAMPDCPATTATII